MEGWMPIAGLALSVTTNVVGGIYFLGNRNSDLTALTTEVVALRGLVALLKDQQSDFRLTVAQNYVTEKQFTRVIERIEKQVSDMASKIDKAVEDLLRVGGPRVVGGRGSGS
jgi:hypothetical protein